MTSGSSGESSWMEGRAGDGSSWFDRVTRMEAGLGACKRKNPTPNSKHLGAPPPSYLRRPGRRQWVLSMMMVGWKLPQKNITSRAISAYYPDFTPATVKAVVGQVLCMIAK